MTDKKKKAEDKKIKEVIEAGIVRVGLDLYNIRVSRRMFVNEFAPSRQFFRRRNNVKGLNQARKVKRELTDELAAEALKHEGRDVKWRVVREEYIANVERRYRDEEIQRSSMEDRIGTVNKHLSCWDDKWLSEFTADKIEAFMATASIKKLEVRTQQKILLYIRSIFIRQVRMGRLNHDPSQGLRVRRKKQKEPPKTMTPEQIKQVTTHARTDGGMWGEAWSFVYEVAFYTGARSGELYALEWHDVLLDDPKNKRIKITKSYDWKIEQTKPTKNKSYRILPVSPKLEKVLRQLRERYPNAIHVLPRIPDWKQGKAAEVLKGYQKSLQWKKEDFTNFHSIRATTITSLLLRGESLLRTQLFVGHESIKTTELYARATGRDLQNLTDGLDLDGENNVIQGDFEHKKKAGGDN